MCHYCGALQARFRAGEQVDDELVGQAENELRRQHCGPFGSAQWVTPSTLPPLSQPIQPAPSQ